MSKSHTTNPHGWKIALQLIKQEASEQTGVLDLGMLGLAELPDEMFELDHLVNLNLGEHYLTDENEATKTASHSMATNRISSLLGKLADLPNLKSLSLSGTNFEELKQIKDCRLSHLNIDNTFVHDMRPLANLEGLNSLFSDNIGQLNLSQITNFSLLRLLKINMNYIDDLSPLKDLASLQTLDCSGTQVSDLSPLKDLPSLQSLDCSGTQVSDLSPLKYLPRLQTLGCQSTQVSDLSPLKDLPSLQTLYCQSTQVSDLSPLNDLPSLQTLYCPSTQVSDLSPLKDLASLQTLDCSDTQVSDLSPLKDLPSLQSLRCSSTRVRDLSPLKHVRNIRANNCILSITLEGLVSAGKLTSICLYGSRVPGVADEALSAYEFSNCLNSLQAHYEDLGSQPSVVRSCKLIVLGNGRIGKTQICHRLDNNIPEVDPISTHGVTIIPTSRKLQYSNQLTDVSFYLWDFGGQDIYHGTHALFLKTRAIFMVVWTPDSNDAGEHEYRGTRFRNYRLEYWLTYVRNLGKSESPLLIVQNQCDQPADEEAFPPISADDLNPFTFKKILHYSAHENRGRAALEDAIGEAALHVLEKEGTAQIGAGRLEIRNRLEQWRTEDAKLPSGQRRHRTIRKSKFAEMCEEVGKILSVEMFLQFLHNSCVVFYDGQLFGEQIILDQSWALDAIYSIFDREKSYSHLKALRGRFTRGILELLVWEEYSEAEQLLFLSLMESCNVCFRHGRSAYGEQAEPEYIAPDLLPLREEVESEIAARWTGAVQEKVAVFEYPFLHDALVRSIISQVGRLAGDSAVYWKYGVCLYENTTSAHAIIDANYSDDSTGKVEIRANGNSRDELIRRIVKLIKQENQKLGLSDIPIQTDIDLDEKREKVALVDEIDRRVEKHPKTNEVSPKVDLSFTDPPRPSDKHKYFVSYAWGDDSAEGEERRQAIEELCSSADQRGVEIIRDETHMKVGELISKFMDRIGKGDKIFIILSDKYLRSEFCMFELFQIWRNSKSDPEKLAEKITVYKLPCASIKDVEDKLEYVKFWKKRYEKISESVEEAGVDYAGPEIVKKWMGIREFAQHTGDILSHLSDVLKPNDIEGMLDAGLD